MSGHRRRLVPARPCGIEDGCQEEAASPEVLAVPLKRGKDQATIGHNIGKLISEGYPRDQASAIAYDYSKRSNKGKKK